MRTRRPIAIATTLGGFLFLAALTPPPSLGADTLKETMDAIVSRIYATVQPDSLAKIDEDSVREMLTDEERHVLATKYWCFDVNVPVVVSVLRHNEQKIVPFWLPEAGFRKTELTARNEEYVYEIWQKEFDAGRVELGINGFDRHRPHYFVSVGPQSPEAKLELTNFFPENQTVLEMRAGSLTYHDWTELVLTEVPASLRGQSLLTTIRGRSREAHLIGAFRKTPFPSSAKPDLINLTWTEDPRTTQTVQWRTNTDVTDGVVRYREKESGPEAAPAQVEATCTKVEDRLLCNDRFCHRFTATLRDLKPATTYVYRVGSPAKDSWSDRHEFTTAPDADRPFSFIYLGDTHRSPVPGQLLRKALETCPNAAFCLLAGDLVDTGLYRNEWDEFFTHLGHFCRTRSLVPAIGNHDDQEGLGAAMYLTMFALPQNGPGGIEPERAYSVHYGNALVAVLDIGSPLDPQAVWLDGVLSKTDARWKFVMLHFPPFLRSGDYEELRKGLTPLCDKHHVDAVLTGHIHVYLRTHPMKGGTRVDKPSEGTTYITSIAIPNREFKRKTPDWAAAFVSGPALYQTFEIDGDRCVYRARDLEGRVRDEMVIEK